MLKSTAFSLSTLLIFSFFLSALVGCKRYEDGPLISFRSPKARVTNDWSASLVSRNEIRETQFYCRYDLNFTKDNNFVWFLQAANTSDTALTLYEGTWDLISDKTQIRLEFTSAETPTFSTQNLIMDIVRLKEKEMWVNYLINGDRFFAHFEPAGSFTSDSTRCSQ